jgi:hypothetical protein
MKWITREHPKIDQIASTWLIWRFVDIETEFMYVPFDSVRRRANGLSQPAWLETCDILK